MLTEVRHRVEVEIERGPGEEVCRDLRVPSRQQVSNLLRGNARRIFRQEAFLRHGIEPAEQGQPLIGDQGHDVALAFHSLSASEARSAWAAGIMREPGSLAACANASLSSCTRSGMNRNSPPIRVGNSRGVRTKS